MKLQEKAAYVSVQSSPLERSGESSDSRMRRKTRVRRRFGTPRGSSRHPHFPEWQGKALGPRASAPSLCASWHGAPWCTRAGGWLCGHLAYACFAELVSFTLALSQMQLLLIQEVPFCGEPSHSR